MIYNKKKKKGRRSVKKSYDHGGVHWPPDGLVSESTNVVMPGLPQEEVRLLSRPDRLSQAPDEQETVSWLSMLSNPMKAARWAISNPGLGESEEYRKPTPAEWDSTPDGAMDFTAQVLNPATFAESVLKIDESLTEADKVLLQSFKNGNLSGSDLNNVWDELSDAAWNALFLLGAKPTANVWKSVLGKRAPQTRSLGIFSDNENKVNVIKQLNKGVKAKKELSSINLKSTNLTNYGSNGVTEGLLADTEKGLDWMKNYLNDPAIKTKLETAQAKPKATRPSEMVEGDDGLPDIEYLQVNDPQKAASILYDKIKKGLDVPVRYKFMENSVGKATISKYNANDRLITINPSDPDPFLTMIHEIDHTTLGTFMEESGDLQILKKYTQENPNYPQTTEPEEIRARVMEMRLLAEVATNKPVTTNTKWNTEETKEALDRWIEFTMRDDIKVEDLMKKSSYNVLGARVPRGGVEFFKSLRGGNVDDKIQTLQHLLNNLMSLTPIAIGSSASQSEKEYEGSGVLKLKNPTNLISRLAENKSLNRQH